MGLINFNIQLPTFSGEFSEIGSRLKSQILGKINFDAKLNDTSIGSGIENAMGSFTSQISNINLDTFEMPEIDTNSMIDEAMGGMDFNALMDEQIARINSGEFDSF